MSSDPSDPKRSKEQLVRLLAEKLRGGPEPACKNCDDTGYYFDNNGHGQLTWKRECPCRRSC
jgi:hypothetical protein